MSETDITGDMEEREPPGSILFNKALSEEHVIPRLNCGILSKRLRRVQAVSPFVGDKVGETGYTIGVSQKY